MGWFGDHQWETWLIIAAVLAGFELVSLDLVLVMLAGGAVVGGVAALIGAPVVISAVAALITAVALLTLLRPAMVHRLHAGPSLRTGSDALVGRRATVLRELGGLTPGRVKIGGEEWAALPYDEDDRFEPGEVVDVVQIQGATAYVLRVNALGG